MSCWHQPPKRSWWVSTCRLTPAARRLAEAEGVSIRLYDIIYRLTEDVEKALKGMLTPELKEVVVGKAEVLAVFKISKVGQYRRVQGGARGDAPQCEGQGQPRR